MPIQGQDVGGSDSNTHLMPNAAFQRVDQVVNTSLSTEKEKHFNEFKKNDFTSRIQLNQKLHSPNGSKDK